MTKLYEASTIAKAAMQHNKQLVFIIQNLCEKARVGESVYSFFGQLTESTHHQLEDLGYKVEWERGCHKITARL